MASDAGVQQGRPAHWRSSGDDGHCHCHRDCYSHCPQVTAQGWEGVYVGVPPPPPPGPWQLTSQPTYLPPPPPQDTQKFSHMVGCQYLNRQPPLAKR